MHSDNVNLGRCVVTRLFVCMAAIVVLAIGPAGCGGGSGTDSGTSGVTMANYQRLTAGMSHQSVVDLLGAPGQLQERSETAGVTTVTYLWVTGHDGSNLSVKFTNDTLAVKTQFGLK